MGSKLLDVKYYVKKDDKVRRITEKEYKELLKKLKDEGKSYICPNCRVCTCEKIRYTDITRCEEVGYGVFILKTYESSGESKTVVTRDKTFQVFECDQFEPFRDIAVQQEISTKNEILDLDMKILKLKDESNSLENNEKIKNLLKLRKMKLQCIHEESVLEDLEKEARKQKDKYLKEKSLKLENKS